VENSFIFVFGSNLRGIHGAGAAKLANQKYGAVLGIGKGPTGRSYALPTKSTPYSSLKPIEIRRHVNDFLVYARANPKETFVVTRVGCGLAGFPDRLIAPFFIDAPSNCIFDIKWKFFLGEDRKYFEESV